MDQLSFETPDNLKNSEEKWLKIFSKKAFGAVLCAAAFGFIICKIAKFLGYSVVGIILALILVVITYLLTTITIPSTWIMSGGGVTLDIYLLRIIIRKRKKVIYVKNYKGGK